MKKIAQKIPFPQNPGTHIEDAFTIGKKSATVPKKKKSKKGVK